MKPEKELQIMNYELRRILKSSICLPSGIYKSTWITIITDLLSLTAYSQKGKQKDDVDKVITAVTIGQNGISGPYSPDVNSIRTHTCPDWFRDAKFGMFIDWGVYSVPGWAKQPENDDYACYPDWYLHDMVFNKSVKEYHEQTWGKDFMPDDFIPMFTAENYEPEKLVQLAAEAGMKYIVPFCKHHDGFCLWPSSYTGRDAMDMGQHKDLVHPLVNECSRLGMKFGFYFSVEEWCTPMIINGEKKIVTICTDFPEKELVLQYLYLTKDSKITMLGAENIELEWKAITDRDHKFDVAVQIPESLYEQRKNEYAWVFRIKY
jgi:hypothetical protein